MDSSEYLRTEDLDALHRLARHGSIKKAGRITLSNLTSAGLAIETGDGLVITEAGRARAHAIWSNES